MDERGELRIRIRARGDRSLCPECGCENRRVHSRYKRRLQDLPLGEYGVVLELQVRRYFCENEACCRRIYTERLPEIVSPSARRTRRLEEKLGRIGIALGGAAGARLSEELGYGVSDSTLLYLVSKLPLPENRAVKVVGVDDFAFRKGQRYGTILVDLEAGVVIDLLEDREAATLAGWLRAHPQVEILSRDRSTTYRQGMNAGAPEAMQVVDRFHLLQNLEEALESSLREDKSTLKAVERNRREERKESVGGAALVVEETRPIRSAREEQLKAERGRERRERYESARHLKAEGYSAAAVARAVGISVRTVRRWLQGEGYRERQGRSDCGQRRVNAYKGYLLKWYGNGERNIRQLYRKLKGEGYPGSYRMVARYMQQLDIPEQPPWEQRQLVELGILRLTVKRAASMVMQVPDVRDAEGAELLRRLRQNESKAGEAIRFAERFLRMVRQRTPAVLDRWLQEVEQSGIKPLVRFAEGIGEDYEAIRAALTLEVSNAQEDV
ncbi:MAG: ISL3 family transposase [Cyanobacteria bacterium J06638_22]